MPSKWSWYDEGQRIALVEYSGKVTVDELSSVLQELIDEAANGPMYYISYTGDAQIPVGVLKEKVARTFMSHPNNRFVAVAPQNAFGQYILQVIARGKTTGHKTLEEAIKAAEAKVASDQAEN